MNYSCRKGDGNGYLFPWDSFWPNIIANQDLWVSTIPRAEDICCKAQNGRGPNLLSKGWNQAWHNMWDAIAGTKLTLLFVHYNTTFNIKLTYKNVLMVWYLKSGTTKRFVSAFTIIHFLEYNQLVFYNTDQRQVMGKLKCSSQ